MRSTCMLTGVVTTLDGLLTTVFSKTYIKRFWGVFNLGPEYKGLINSYASLPDRTIRLFGIAELILGASLLLPDRKGKQQMQLEEEVSKERFSKLLRDLAESLDKSSGFQAVIRGQEISIPPEADVKIEYEQKERGGELELEVKWEGAA